MMGWIFLIRDRAIDGNSILPQIKWENYCLYKKVVNILGQDCLIFNLLLPSWFQWKTGSSKTSDPCIYVINFGNLNSAAIFSLNLPFHLLLLIRFLYDKRSFVGEFFFINLEHLTITLPVSDLK